MLLTMTFAADKGYCYDVRALYQIKISLIRSQVYLIFSGIEIILFIKLYYLPLKSRDGNVVLALNLAVLILLPKVPG